MPFLIQWTLFGQVAAVVFTEDLKRLYVTMKEGFPLEYVVSPPSNGCCCCFYYQI